MKVSEVILVCMMLFPPFVFGQGDRDTLFRSDTVDISSPRDPNNTVVICENSTFKVSTDYKSLILSLKSHIKAHGIDWDKSLLKQLEDNSKTIEQRIAVVQSDPLLETRLQFRTMDLLKAGKCIVQNRTSGAKYSKLIYQDYQKNWWTGTRFLTLDGQLIFDVRTGTF